MAEIRWTAEAQRWLEDIFEYVAADDPQAGARTVKGIYERAQDLVSFPEMGHRYSASSRHVRILLYGHFRIAYLVMVTGTLISSVCSMARSISPDTSFECT